MSIPNGRGSCYRNPEQEIADLKQKLWEMNNLCQQLQEKFELMENKLRISEMQTNASHATSNDYDFDTLKEKLRELVTMNMNWQKYNTKQEKIIAEQGEKIARLERELATRSPGQLPESQQIEFDQLLLAKKHECNALEEEKERTVDENRRLRLRLDDLEKSLAENKERCGLLEAQLIMYQEDFKTERSDRERAQSKIIELEAKLAEKFRNQTAFPVQATSEYNPYDSYNHPLSYDMPLRGRGIYQTDGGVDEGQKMKGQGGQGDLMKNSIVLPTTSVFQTDGFDETDHTRVLDLTEDLPNHHMSLSDVLSCPKCRKTFTRDRHLDLLEHMEECD